MKKLQIISILFLGLLLIVSCEKDDKEDENTNTTVINGQEYKILANDGFNNLIDTADWNFFNNGKIEISDDQSHNGSSYISLFANEQCFRIERIEGVTVNKDKIYMINFQYKLLGTQIGEPGYFVGDFMIWLQQGDETIFMDGCSETEQWTDQFFYFLPVNNVPVKVILLIGTAHGVWLDDLIFLEEI